MCGGTQRGQAGTPAMTAVQTSVQHHIGHRGRTGIPAVSFHKREPRIRDRKETAQVCTASGKPAGPGLESRSPGAQTGWGGLLLIPLYNGRALPLQSSFITPTRADSFFLALTEILCLLFGCRSPAAEIKAPGGQGVLSVWLLCYHHRRSINIC